MYTKDSTCGGFLETGDEFLISDKRNEDINRVFVTNAYDFTRKANCMDLPSNWNNHPVKVSTLTKEVACSNQYLGSVADLDCERHRKRYRQNSRYVQVPNYDVLPTRCNSDHAQLAKRRKLQEETGGQGDAGQMFDAKRSKIIGNLDAVERRRISAETKFEVFSNVASSPLHKMEPWKRFSEAGDVWNSSGSEGERRFFRPVQPALHLNPSSEACPEEKETQARTSSRVNPTGSRLAKENVAALDYMPVARLSQQPNFDLTMNSEYFKTECNRNIISDEYSSQILDSTSPYTTTFCLQSSVQPYQRNLFDRIKSDNVYHLRDSISSSLSSAEPPRAMVVSAGGTTFQKDFPRVEIPDPRLSFCAQSESWRKRESAEDGKTWSAGMPLHRNEDLRMKSWYATSQERIEPPKFPVLPSNMEEIKENVLTDSMPCYRNRYFGENRSGYRESQIAKVEELPVGEWRTLEKPWQQGIPESSLGRIEHQSAEYVSGNVLARGPTKYSQYLERPSRTDDNHVVSKTSRDQFIIGADGVYARDAAIRRREMSKNNDRSDNIFTDMSSSRRWTSPDYSQRTFQNGRHVYARQTLMPRAKSLSPSLLSNVVSSGNFGSLESIRAYYRTMGRLSKSSSSSSSSFNSKGVNNRNFRDESIIIISYDQCPETITNGPIDLSRRVRKREHNEPMNTPPSEMSTIRCSAHALTFGKQAPSDDSPKTGSSDDVENYRNSHALSVSLPNSRISSPSPDSHLPPKKRRYLSYEWVAMSESKAAEEGSDSGMWVEEDVVKSTGHELPVDNVNLSRCCPNNRHFCSNLTMK